MTDTNDAVVDTAATATADAAPAVSPRETFIQSLPEQFRADPVFANFNSFEDLAKSYHGAAKLVGMDKAHVVALPKEPTPEAMAPIWDKMGRPADPKGYEIERFKDTLPPEVLTKYADIAHKSGISKSAFQGMVSEFVNESVAGQKAAAEQEAQQVAAWQGEVKQEFGMAYDQKLGFARKAAEQFGLTEVIKSNLTFFEQPAIIKALAAIGEKTSEGMVLANGSVSHGKLAPGEANMEIARFNSDPENIKAMTNKSHPNHEYVMKKRAELFKYAFPE